MTPTAHLSTPRKASAGPATRAAIAAVCGGVVTPGPGPGPVVLGTVTVSSGVQPVNSLAPLLTRLEMKTK